MSGQDRAAEIDCVSYLPRHNCQALQAQEAAKEFHCSRLCPATAGNVEEVKFLPQTSKRIDEAFLQHMHETHLCRLHR